ncbi:hypothetical protein BO94DRAFT_545586 [Aspergillus sclerotioniger CBS 115572]|uniref:Heterokaryon incompatibility domain-containing protein n=1 Tax=Aspergillus sclerotioniger CBS 115572 TaxID=1450535 RepID=A0A317WTE7_9EURO|nr:hypothetical protein BO94DRAFT_545586 [Aspergillus sclerotioniger CBS 115572]PWY89609.1 hypothetical protein BO94DRAFT_545586 [Aspergillus sclerotioniger CBS 115572]
MSATGDDPATEDTPSTADRAPQRKKLLGGLRDVALSTSLVTNAMELKHSAVNEMTTVKGSATKDESSREEKLQSLLNLLVRSRREAVLYNDFVDTLAIEDSDLLLGPFAGQVDETAVPLRMFDLDTLNMVDASYFGEEDQYCMLSHSWKGAENDYAYVCEAQLAERISRSDDHNDVSAVLDLCNHRILKVAGKLERILQERSGVERSIRKLLVESLRTSMLERALTAKRKMRTMEDANKRQSDLEQNNYQRLLDFLGEERTILSLEKRRLDAEEQQAKALKEWSSAEQDYEAAKSEILKFRSDRQSIICDRRLIKGAAAKEIGARPFSKTGRRYIWLDNCCIDKRQDAELTESLARMGEWYANADFCLVHLDTPWDNREWLDEWDSWCNSPAVGAEKYRGEDSEDSDDDNVVVSANGKAEPRRKPVTQFEEIKEWKPTWATRGWTLQELVLSKMTFYVNAEWQMLSRPIDVLGTYYHFCPFVDYYTRNLSHVRDREHLDIKAELNKTEIREALDEIATLENGEVMKWEHSKTATPGEGKEMVGVQSIIRALELFKYVAPKELNKETARSQIGYSVQVAVRAIGDQSSSSDSSRHQVARELVMRRLSDDVPPGKRVKQTIDLLLRGLAKSANEFVRQDRQIIASFSNIQDLSSWSNGTERNRFSAHTVMTLAAHRECTKAIDKAYSLMGVLGVQFPAFPAEGLTKALSRLLDEVVITSNDISVFDWTGKYNGSPLRGRSLYASNVDSFQAESEGYEARSDVNGELVCLFRDDRIKRLKVAKGITNLLLDATKFVTVFQQAEATVDALLKLVEFIRTERLESLRSRLGSSELVEIIARAGKYSQQNENERLQKEQERMQKEERKSRGRFTTPLPSLHKVPSWRRDSAAKDMEKRKEDKTHEDRLAELGKKIQNTVPKALRGDVTCADENNAFLAAGLHFTDPRNDNIRSEARDRPIICPNPIVVNSSGIKGVFDIQRIVVKLLQAEELRTRVKNAISDNEKIEGWCTISTGFALTMVAFCCERHILSKQLDLVDVVDQNVLEEPDSLCRGEDDTLQQHVGPGEVSNKPLSTKVLPSGGNGDSPTKKPLGPKRSQSSMHDSDSSESIDQPKLDNYGRSAEQRKVSRMIDFVTEPHLHAIAGEWVLARFSGAVGAKWFLCRLELGSGNEFYARRIATDEFDFANAVPEKGLVEFWHSFLHEKKLAMCDMLEHYLDAQKAGNYASSLHDNLQESFGLRKMVESSDDEDETEAQEPGENPRNYGRLTPASKFFKMIGWGLRYTFDEFWARHLERHLEGRALAKVPLTLHAAIKDLDANKILLPVMFHSGKDVHFF